MSAILTGRTIEVIRSGNLRQYKDFRTTFKFIPFKCDNRMNDSVLL
jgi:hypothetical protein